MEHVKIITGYENDLSKVKKEIVQRADYIHTRLTYPNGVIIDMEQLSNGEVNVKCNKELREVSPGVYKPIV